MSILRIAGTPNDWTDWDKLTQNVDTYEELTEIEKSNAKRSLLFLQAELGRDFLKSALEGLRIDRPQPEKIHPIMHWFINSAPWTLKWITRIADALNSLKNAEGYIELLTKLKEKEHFLEALSLIWTATKLANAGFKVSIIPASNERKTPDLKILNTENKEEICIEVSEQMPSMNSNKALKTFWEIHNLFTFLVFEKITYCGRILKALSDRHKAEVIEEIKKKIQIVKEERTFQELIIEGTLEVAIAPLEEINTLEKWAASKELPCNKFFGPPNTEDELRRTKALIQREQQQIPKESPGMLVLYNNFLFSDQSINTLIYELEECLYEFSNILFFVIVDLKEYDTSGIGNRIIVKNQHLFCQKVLDVYNIENTLILHNRFSSFNISNMTTTKIRQAFCRS